MDKKTRVIISPAVRDYHNGAQIALIRQSFDYLKKQFPGEKFFNFGYASPGEGGSHVALKVDHTPEGTVETIHFPDEIKD